MKRIVLFVEGDGEAEAAPILVKKLLTEQNAWDAVWLDPSPFRVGEVSRLVKDDYREWKRFLGASLKRRDVGGVLLILDGDLKKLCGRDFCAATAATAIAGEARALGGATKFSVAVVFALQEYESWLIAGVESLAGKRLGDGRAIKSNVKPPDGDLEEAPRNAKGCLRDILEGGYQVTRDQALLTHLVEPAAIRARNLRSFRRLESALSELLAAIRNDKHVVTPFSPDDDEDSRAK